MMSTVSPNPMPTGLVPEKPSALSVLSICYYILGALGAICVIIAGLMVITGIVMLTYQESILSNPKLQEMLHAILAEQGDKIANMDIHQLFIEGSWKYIIFGGLWLFFATIYTTLHFYAAICFSKGKKYIFCMIASCISLLDLPLGTALGIASLIILSKENIKQYFKTQKQGNVTNAPTIEPRIY